MQDYNFTGPAPVMEQPEKPRPWAVLNYAGMAAKALADQEASKPTLAQMKARVRPEGLAGASIGAIRRMQLHPIIAAKLMNESGQETDEFGRSLKGAMMVHQADADQEAIGRAARLLGREAIADMWAAVRKRQMIDALADQAEAQEAAEDDPANATSIAQAEERRQRKAAKREGK